MIRDGRILDTTTPRCIPPTWTNSLSGGAIFSTNHYVMSQCTPTRVALMTGNIPAGSALMPLQPAPNPLSPKELIPWPPYSKRKDMILVSPGNGIWAAHQIMDPIFLGLIKVMAVSPERSEITTTATVRGPLSYLARNHQLIEGSENGVHTTQLITDDAIRFIRQKGITHSSFTLLTPRSTHP